MALFQRVVIETVDVDASVLLIMTKRSSRKLNRVQYQTHSSKKDCYKYSIPSYSRTTSMLQLTTSNSNRYLVVWKQHIEHIRLKIAKTIGIIYRLKSIYPSAILLTLYNTLVTPHLHYCLLCWGSIIKENDLLHIMQKRVLRTITNSNYIAHTEPLFKELKLVKITDMYVIAIWKFIIS